MDLEKSREIADYDEATAMIINLGDIFLDEIHENTLLLLDEIKTNELRRHL